MGTSVLDAPAATGVRLYGHCLRGAPGGVALLAINLDREASRSRRGELQLAPASIN